MAASAEKLGGKREAAMLALLTNRTIEEAARAADVPLRSIYRWLKEPEFSAAYREAKRTAFGQAVARLQQGTGAAAAVMLKTHGRSGHACSHQVTGGRLRLHPREKCNRTGRD
jgi:hypothetical protein